MVRVPSVCLAAAALASAAPRGAGQSPASVPAPTPARAAACASPEFRQFDFWVGEWEVTKRDGEVAGVNRIAPILRGCVLHEDWHGAQGTAGQSFNIYDAASDKWRQTWVADDGLVLLLEGGLVDGKMVLAGRRPSRQHPGATIFDRVTWTPLEGGAVRQVWEISEDDGVTWRTVFDGRYAKRRPVTPPGG